LKYCCFLLCLVSNAQLIAALKPETVREFESYQADVEQERQQRSQGQRGFLWIDEHADRKREAEEGKVVTVAITGSDGRSVTGGLVHDWVGDIYLRNVKLETVRDFLLATERHPAVFNDVKQAKVLSRETNSSVTLLRFLKKKYLTVVLDVEFKNDWRQLGAGRWIMNARSAKVSEIQDAGTAAENPLPPDTGHGFLWRMNSHWSLRQDPGGTWVELRSVTLSRDTPRGLGWMIRPMIRNFPAEAITGTLESTQKALR
jgi:hypothetical protein